MTDSKDIILQQIANTIVANLGNTTGIGLMEGKAGLCLFFYEYARYTGMEYYEDLANQLLDDVLHALKPSLSPSVVDGTAGIGCVILHLLDKDFIQTDDGENLLRDLDNAMFNNVSNLCKYEMDFPMPVFSPGIYLVKRLKSYRVSSYLKNVVDKSFDAILDIRARIPMQSLSYVNSLLYIVENTGAYISDKYNLEIIKSAIHDSFYEILKYGKYTDVDVSILKMMKQAFPFNNEMLDNEILSHEKDNDSRTMYYDGWWRYIYDVETIYDSRCLATFIEKKSHDCFYDMSKSNSLLAVTGLLLITNINSL